MRGKTLTLFLLVLWGCGIACKNQDRVKKIQDQKQLQDLKNEATHIAEWLSTYASISKLRPSALVSEERELEKYLDSILKANVSSGEYESIKLDILNSSNILEISKRDSVNTYFVANGDTLTMLDSKDYQVLKTLAVQSSKVSF